MLVKLKDNTPQGPWKGDANTHMPDHANLDCQSLVWHCSVQPDHYNIVKMLIRSHKKAMLPFKETSIARYMQQNQFEILGLTTIVSSVLVCTKKP